MRDKVSASLFASLSITDPEITELLRRETERQQNTINLIAAENYAPQSVLEAQGSLLTNKYAEGYPYRRYYAGCKEIDEVERIAIERAKKLFGAEYANVQPHSGTQANMAAYFALLQPGDKVLAMNLSHGGHLSHGSPVNFSGQFYNFIHYGVDRETERLDYEEVERLALKHRPKLIVAGASSYPRIIDFERFHHIAKLIGAKLMVDMAHIAGLVAAGLHPSPIPYSDIITSSSHKTLRGPRSGFILCKEKWAKAIDAMVFPGMQGGPLMHVIAAKAVAFQEAMQPQFATYQQKVIENARTLAQGLKDLGLRLVSGGTDNHLILVDLTSLGITGRQAEAALEEVGIIVNRNAIPFDPRPPQIASGIRLGTPPVTTRGFDSQQMKRIAQIIMQVLTHISDEGIKKRVKEEVVEMCHHSPIPGI
jgi:glycine hydroxymethyltransferase